jgi:plastocyanin
VTQANLTFTPAEISVHQGDSITVEDTDSVPHTFTVEGTSIDVTNQAGQSQTVAIDLKPGTYSVICRFHVSMGMKATLVVA